MLKISMKNNDLFAELEIYHYEFCSYTDILNNIKTYSGYNEEYWLTWDEYMKTLVKYETLKEKLRINCIIPEVGDNFNGVWQADFDNEELIITPSYN